MKIIHNSMNVANAVLSIFENCINEDKNDSFYIEPYKNGRENGYSVLNWNKDVSVDVEKMLINKKKAIMSYHRKVSFSENRNSDSIVVYFGNTNDFSMQGNVPNKDVYSKKKFFTFSEYFQAACFIYEYLTGTIQ